MFRISSGFRASSGAVLTLLVATALFLAASESAYAADFTVTKTADTADGTCDADCSLREAISAANAAAGADTITLPAGTYTLSIAGTGDDVNATGDLDATETVAINGTGSASTIIDGGDIDRVFNTISGTTDLTLNGVTVQNGDAGLEDGGGVLASGALTVNNSTLTSNEADQGAGIVGSAVTLTNSHVDGNVGADQGAGIWACCGAATFTITNSTVDNNVGGDQGAGVFHCCGDFTLTITRSSVSGNQGNDQGGGVFFCCGDAATNITIVDSHIDNNVATDQGGGLFYCCGSDIDPAVDSITISNSTFNGNTAAGDGGGIFICCEATNGTNTSITGTTIANNTITLGDGGGIFTDGAVTIVNTTIHGNTAAESGGGISCGGGTLSLTNVTITGNTAQSLDTGGGISCSEFDALNTIIAGNTDGGTAPDCDGDLNSLGNNLIQDTTGCTIGGDTTGNITGVDPQLGALAANGGLTQTRAVVPGTPPHNAGRNAGCPATDQRGVARPQEGTCEIGAYEYQVVTPTPSVAATPTGAPAALPPTGGPAEDGAGQAWLFALVVLGAASVAGMGTFAVARRRD